MQRVADARSTKLYIFGSYRVFADHLLSHLILLSSKARKTAKFGVSDWLISCKIHVIFSNEQIMIKSKKAGFFRFRAVKDVSIIRVDIVRMLSISPDHNVFPKEFDIRMLKTSERVFHFESGSVRIVVILLYSFYRERLEGMMLCISLNWKLLSLLQQWLKKVVHKQLLHSTLVYSDLFQERNWPWVSRRSLISHSFNINNLLRSRTYSGHVLWRKKSNFIDVSDYSGLTYLTEMEDTMPCFHFNTTTKLEEK